jgi:hypothetical protein
MVLKVARVRSRSIELANRNEKTDPKTERFSFLAIRRNDVGFFAAKLLSLTAEPIDQARLVESSECAS